MNRRSFVLMTAAVMAATGSFGCGGGGGGGGSDLTTITTGANGTLSRVQISPLPGGTFIPRASSFQLAWTAAQPPPPEFAVGLYRYKEAGSGEPREANTQRVDVSKGTGFTWNVDRDGNTDLDARGVYYLQLTTPGGQEVLSTYIVGANRAQDTTRAETVKPGTSGRLDTVTISPSPGSTFIPKATNFQISWSTATPPPAEFTVALRRYKEDRKGDSFSDEEQKITVTQQGSALTWNIKRRDDFVLDPDGVYYLELAASGATPVRAAYLVSGER